MKIIGITGGIGSGKSTVSTILRNDGFDIIDADKIAREILISENSQELLEKLVSTFGQEIIKDGILDRKKLAFLAFRDRVQKGKLDQIMMPGIIDRIKFKISELEKLDKEIVFLDAPLLFETGLNELCFENWLVHADEKLRILRVINRDQVSEEQVRMRMKFQMQDAEKMKLSNFIIDNSKDMLYLEEQIQSRLEELLNR